ncbi:heterokaryon incompatibility protein-domain-containing protein [Podospora conica]|nr:heterokaryon incompatibility protein-domain-containing protein [Schizothecium conicum]
MLRPGREDQRPIVGCSTCSGFFRASQCYEETEQPCDKVRDSALMGCSFCALIFNGVSLLRGDAMLNEVDGYTFGGKLNPVRIFLSEEGHRLKLLHTAVSGREESRKFEFYAEIGAPLLPGFGPCPHPLAHPGSPNGRNLVLNLVEACDSQHEGCQWGSPDSPSCLPTRVLDIGDALSGERPRLLVTNGEHAKYIAFSHCWGGHLPLKTTKDTLASHCEAIPNKDIPPSYRDVIQVARWLGIRYIWIDSLCILQDDSADWDQESSRMSAVYRNAYLTVAATSSRNCTESFLAPRKTLSASPLTVAFNGTDYPIHARQIPLNLDNPLYHRAWFFQEIVISPRVLSFAYNDIQWYCKDRQFCECRGSPKPPVDTHNVNLRESRAIFQRELVDTVPRHEIFRSWYYFVEKYTKSALAFPSDRLPALSALAHHFAGKRRGRYLAGLWEGDLIYGLTWERAWHFVPQSAWDLVVSSIPVPNAPSWAWSSTEGPVQFHSSDTLPEISIEHIEYNTVGMNPYGQAKTGILWIRGPMHRAYTERRRGEHDDMTYVSLTLALRHCKKAIGDTLYFSVDSPIKLKNALDSARRSVDAGMEDMEGTLGTDRPQFLEHVWVLRLWGSQSRLGRDVCFLVLRQLKESGAFERIGAARLGGDWDTLKSPSPWLQDWEYRSIELR